ncbi:hypothetical protein KP77_10540 [Jeotgalibacillus alimentarius]|uniref:MFS transporter n=1 Tax=Jeotgalibacillus alimentarius TaxID=135826 RepID=A0A0C2VRK5_9BACL|nr:MFS transporter [Jeotgalibacillus alimentarius]KIL51542.1 hypothetical protein KP77_10540 [Jeotgalibacillus alimentarius]
MKKHSFRYLLTGQSMANLGDVFYIVSLISTIYLLTGSAFYMALLPFFNMSARFLGALAAPHVMDRFALPQLLAYSQGLKTILLLALAVSYQQITQETILMTFLFVTGIAFLDGWASPASHALIPRLVEREHLVKSNGYMGVVTQTIQLSAWPLGGILIAISSAETLIWITVGLYIAATLFAGMLFRLLRISTEESNPAEKDRRAGWKAILRSPFLRVVTLVELIEVNAGVVWIAAIVYVYVAEVLQAGEPWWGYINSSYFAGLIAGGLIAIRVDQLLQRRAKQCVIITAYTAALATIVFGLISNPYLALLLSVLFGFVTQLKGITLNTLVQTNVKEHLLPKVYAAQEAASFSTYAVTTLLAGLLVDLAGVRIVFITAGVLLLGSALLLTLGQKTLDVKAGVSATG